MQDGNRRSELLLAGMLTGLAAATPGGALAQQSTIGAIPDTPSAKPLSLPGGRDEAAPRLGTGSLSLPRGDVIGFDERDRTASASVAGLGRTVLSRARPAYDPIGYRIGSFDFYPALTATSGYVGNVYRQQNARDDIFGALSASGALLSDWGRNALSISGSASQRFYAKFDSEDVLTYRGRVRGLYEIRRDLSVTAEVNRRHEIARRGGTAEILRTREPVRYDLTDGQLSVTKSLTHLKFTFGGYVGRYDYQNARTPAGLRLDQQYRDYTLSRVTGEVGYATGAGPVFFLSGTDEFRRYRVPSAPILRDSDVLEILAGIASEITPLIRGRLAIGYIYANFKDPRVESRGNFSFDADVDYLLTELTTIKLTGRRYYQNVASPSAPSALATDITLGFDHELLRNVILSAAGSYRRSKYVLISRSSTGYGLTGGARWLVNRNLRADVGLEYSNRNRTADLIAVPGRASGQFQGTISLTYTP